MINAAESQLENASESCERWEWGCAGLVVIAVVAELVIAFIHPSYDSFLEQWGSILADAIIALGIVGEVLFSVRDGKVQTELRRRSNDRVSEAITSAEKAHERTASLEKEAAQARARAAEIERLTAWRRIRPEQHEIIVRSLRDKIPLTDLQIRQGKLRRKSDEPILLEVRLEYEADPEATMFGAELENLFISANVSNFWQKENHITIDGKPLFGLFIESFPAIYAVLIKEIFSEAGITVAKEHVYLGGSPSSYQVPRLFIYVGFKPT